MVVETAARATEPASAPDRAHLAQLHESLATLLASRGQWQQAYQHLRSAVDLSREQDESAVLPALSAELRREVDRLRREHAEAREQSLRDSLTDSYNRRYLDQRLDDLLVAMPTGTIAVALVDLDYFKQVNDNFGHQCGDLVLRRVVEVLQDGLPDGAFCARYGGEEFVLVLPELNGAAAVVVCEAARARIERHHWSQLAPGLRVTVSVGVAHRDGRDGLDPAGGVPDLLRSADQLLYQAKQSGRNAVAFHTASGVALAGMAAHRRGGSSGHVDRADLPVVSR